MNSLPSGNDLSGFASGVVLIGEGQHADRIWTREEFISVCNLMRNGNPADEFLHVYCDPNGVPRFVKARSAKADKRITWTWDTITRRAKHKVAVGFYPWNHHGESCWAAMDFDAHDGEAPRARALAGAALQLLRRNPQLYLILATSGSHGWHLFAFTEQFHPVKDWVRLLKRTADGIGAELKSGICEIFPNETRYGSRPHAIRAPGTWNPKTNQLGAIIFTSIAPLLQKKGKKEVGSFLYPSTEGAKATQLNDSKSRSFYCGGRHDWLEQFKITQVGARHAQLRALVYCCSAMSATASAGSSLMRNSWRREYSRKLRLRSIWKNLKNSGHGPAINGVRIFQMPSGESSRNLKPKPNATSSGY